MAAVSFCMDCGFSHVREDRVKYLCRMLPCSVDELREAHPCWWGGTKSSAGERRMYRDLQFAGAKPDLKTHIWAIDRTSRAA